MPNYFLYISVFMCSFYIYAQPAADKVYLEFHEAPIGLVLQALAEQQQLNLILSQQNDERITIKLADVTWQKALEIVLQLGQMTYKREDNLLYVFSQPLQQNETPSKQTNILKKQYFILQHADAEEVSKLLKAHLSVVGNVVVLPAENAILLQDHVEHIENIEGMLIALDKPTPQIQITAHIVTMSEDSLRELGVNWRWEGNESMRRSMQLNELSLQLPISNPAVKMGLNLAKLSGRLLALELAALESENQLEIIASPRLFTLNRHTATIKQGTEIPYEVSGGSAGVTAIEFKEAVLGMEVTPSVKSGDRIELVLKISQNVPGRSLKRGEGEVLSIDKQEIQTRVLVSNGETLALGGVFQQMRQKEAYGVPFLQSLPWVGSLFQRKRAHNTRRELVIFITPTLLQ